MKHLGSVTDIKGFQMCIRDRTYITAKAKQEKWLFGTVGMAVIAAALAVLMTAFIH